VFKKVVRIEAERQKQITKAVSAKLFYIRDLQFELPSAASGSDGVIITALRIKMVVKV
jgi:hypothetical protein